MPSGHGSIPMTTGPTAPTAGIRTHLRPLFVLLKGLLMELLWAPATDAVLAYWSPPSPLQERCGTWTMGTATRAA